MSLGFDLSSDADRHCPHQATPVAPPRPMTPLHELLSRIRWDEKFGQGRVVLGYQDHVLGRIVQVDLREVRFDPDNRSMLDIVGEDGAVHAVPLHRVKDVWRDGVLIWHRSYPSAVRRGRQ